VLRFTASMMSAMRQSFKPDLIFAGLTFASAFVIVRLDLPIASLAAEIENRFSLLARADFAIAIPS
jgi:hypothetical protein